MERIGKEKIFGIMVFCWFVLASCKIPNALSGLGKAIGDMFRSIAGGFGF